MKRSTYYSTTLYSEAGCSPEVVTPCPIDPVPFPFPIPHLPEPPFDDVIDLGAENNIIHGLTGDDRINAGAGDDEIYGDEDNDILTGGLGADLIDGGSGRDVISFVNAASAIAIDFERNRGTLGEAAGDEYRNIEIVWGSNFGDYFFGGHDSIEIHGGSGRDTMIGSSEKDYLLGFDGNDVIAGAEGDDIIDGGAGDDLLTGGEGADQIAGGEGRDVASYAASQSAIVIDLETGYGTGGDAQGDSYIGVEEFRGTKFDDLFVANTESVTVHGGDGRDTMIGGAGHDYLMGDAGSDFIFGGQGRDAIEGGQGDDTIAGGGDADVLVGGLGGDSIKGDSGNDFLDGGFGADVLTGGSGGDVFVLRTGDNAAKSLSGADLIQDFEDGVDRFGLSGALKFTDLKFTAQDADLDGVADVIISHTGTGEVIAVVSHTVIPNLSADDFVSVA